MASVFEEAGNELYDGTKDGMKAIALMIAKEVYRALTTMPMENIPEQKDPDLQRLKDMIDAFDCLNKDLNKKMREQFFKDLDKLINQPKKDNLLEMELVKGEKPRGGDLVVLPYREYKELVDFKTKALIKQSQQEKQKKQINQKKSNEQKRTPERRQLDSERSSVLKKLETNKQRVEEIKEIPKVMTLKNGVLSKGLVR